MTASEFERAVDIQIRLFKRVKVDRETGQKHHEPRLSGEEIREWFWSNDRLGFFNNFPEAQDDPVFVTDKAWRRALTKLDKFYASKEYKEYYDNLDASMKAQEQSSANAKPAVVTQ